MYKSNNGNFKEAIIGGDTQPDLTSDVDIFFFIHDFDGRAKYKYGFKTLEIDLRLTKEERGKDYKSNLRNELRKAEQLSLDIVQHLNPSDDQIKGFVDNYNNFAEYKKLQKISFDLLKMITLIALF